MKLETYGHSKLRVLMRALSEILARFKRVKYYTCGATIPKDMDNHIEEQ